MKKIVAGATIAASTLATESLVANQGSQNGSI